MSESYSPERGRTIDPTQEAVRMSTWFPDYLFGEDAMIGELPQETQIRLRRHFPGDLAAGLRMVCDEIPMLSGDLQPDVAAYICGFPNEDLESLLTHDIKDVVKVLDAAFPPSIEPASFQYDGREALEWHDDALCGQTDPEAFFPEKGGSTRDAKRVCMGCDVRKECLINALKNNERFGIWGGFSERERRGMELEMKRFGDATTYEEIAERAIDSSLEAHRKANAKQALKKASEIAS